ncbi:phosphonate c-p lyase system protein [Leptolyngbya sp. Heron Island J]|nr:phosphonate c-p lyase system protein [Leptolyngbya sp. Heron Island J]
MSTLAKAPLPLLEQCFATLDDVPEYGFLRSPEVGLAMVRARAEGTGQPFNLGEITLTRCVVQLGELTGFGYVAGRSKRHAELAALCDGLLQHPDWHTQVQMQVITPLYAAAQAKREQDAAEVESTRVNFFTMLRGES